MDRVTRPGQAEATFWPLGRGRSRQRSAGPYAKRGSATKALNKALAIWRQGGINVLVARPWPSGRHNCSDTADVILAEGVSAVRRRITAALRPGSGSPSRVSAVEARLTIGAAVAAFFGKVNELPPRSRIGTNHRKNESHTLSVSKSVLANLTRRAGGEQNF